MPNRLSLEKSPYLLQHQNNPVEWYPWGEEAFSRARKEEKPIFLSIGYSTCHWCHVMEHESFEDPKTAEVMNELFINIKVDREERPDVDRIYMSAVQMMTGSGGWPLSVFLTPDLKPFYGGTYFPPKDQYGRPGFTTLLQKIAEVWKSERENVIASGNELLKELQPANSDPSSSAEINESVLKRTYHQFAAGYDSRNGGFGNGMKFPRPSVLKFLFHYHYHSKEPEALSMALTTLMAMASGGMYDNLGGGFHRYAVDPEWRVPHFEKMLYDQAQLISIYVDAFQITGDPFFRRIAEETIDYVATNLRSPEGAFFSAEDADSFSDETHKKKSEGAFYVWEYDEIEALLTKEEFKAFAYYYSIAREGNVQEDPHSEFGRKNILFAPYTIEETAQHCGTSSEAVGALLHSAREKLLVQRNTRPRPHCDDKVITAWNGLMISALAKASFVFKETKYYTMAQNAAEFVLETMFDKRKNVLQRRYRDGEVKYHGQLDDYSFFIEGLIEMYHAGFEQHWLESAVKLQRIQNAAFWNSSGGGYFDSPGKDPSILVRTRELYDGAEPSGNSVSAENLLRLYRLTGERSFLEECEKTLHGIIVPVQQSPQTAPNLMSCTGMFLAAHTQVIILVPESAVQAEKFLDVIRSQFLPGVVCHVVTDVNKLICSVNFMYIQSLKMENMKPTAYLCKNNSCSLPTHDHEEFSAQFR